MKEQFTQGDWVADCYAIECNNQRVAECGYSGAEPDEQEIANAHLIAAAPKMYEFLKRVHTLKDCDMDYAVSWIMDNANDIGDLLDEARGENNE